ncbi:unnamed protein product, partial [Laminaria digitata]
CAEDEKLLRCFREKGEQLEDASLPVVPPVPAVSPVPGVPPVPAAVNRVAMPPPPLPSPSLFSISSFSASPSSSPSLIRRLSPHDPKVKLKGRVNRRSTRAPGACMRLDEDGSDSSTIATDRSRSDVAPVTLSNRGKEKENSGSVVVQQRSRAGSECSR